ncbi:MAG: SGNH/GDSL hydrolase family protein [Kiritimatiellia bacterium]
MNIVSRLLGILRLCLIGGVAFMLSACEQTGEGGGLGGGHDFGDNDPNVVYCMGDSITRGTDGPSYVDVLAGLIGKTCINGGIGGSPSASGAGRVDGVIASIKPGYMVIFYGHNDCWQGGATGDNVRYMINACQNAKVVPIVCNLTPMYFGHEIFSGTAHRLSIEITAVAKEEGAKVADTWGAFGTDESLLMPDGLHPNQEGANVIASTIADLF